MEPTVMERGRQVQELVPVHRAWDQDRGQAAAQVRAKATGSAQETGLVWGRAPEAAWAAARALAAGTEPE